MKRILKIAAVTAALVFIYLPDIAYGQYGIRRRTARRTTVVVASTAGAASKQQAAAAQQQAAAANQQTAAAQQQVAVANEQAAAANHAAAVAQQEAAAARHETAVAKGLLPFGTVVPKLPAGCTSVVLNNVAYSKCGVNYYRAVFDGNSLVYMTAEPPPG